ncbi:hypothetical protein SODALDRAFT_380401 [Sodiomyces alkalinus F11]|uniref:Cysteine-rich transmembrane domain-containing protein n=1 Tax=Sodiomyces alkalinus (strain CBS 110278 / VKM F-3762 / F11) TaxID=1314773 RepID=A0A3N2PR38_SODAK|nr:hypothetical protein SODALDRAFT_380401 [Sodiomyces alkalinus F11]ROT36914.1 hypothetical protein SODALDRAFT_380401 [Sodiomyces alkalinus F11]
MSYPQHPTESNLSPQISSSLFGQYYGSPPPPEGYPPPQGYPQGYPPPEGYPPPGQQPMYYPPQPQPQAPPPQEEKSHGCLYTCIATLCCCWLCGEACSDGAKGVLDLLIAHWMRYGPVSITRGRKGKIAGPSLGMVWSRPSTSHFSSLISVIGHHNYPLDDSLSTHFPYNGRKKSSTLHIA